MRDGSIGDSPPLKLRPDSKAASPCESGVPASILAFADPGHPTIAPKANPRPGFAVARTRPLSRQSLHGQLRTL